MRLYGRSEKEVQKEGVLLNGPVISGQIRRRLRPMNVIDGIANDRRLNTHLEPLRKEGREIKEYLRKNKIKVAHKVRRKAKSTVPVSVDGEISVVSE